MSADRPTIDLGQFSSAEPYALIYLGMFLRHHNRLGKYFYVASSEPVSDYLTSQHFWKRFNFNPDPERDKGLLRFIGQQTSFEDIIDLVDRREEADDACLKVQQILQNQRLDIDIDEVMVVTAELVQNFVEHADRGLAAMMMQYYPELKRFRLAIGDCGVGIRHSLYSSGSYPELAHVSHKEAISKALEMMVTSKIEGGMGFYTIRESARKLNAELFISSGNGCIYMDTRGRLSMDDVPHDLTGVQVEISVPERSKRP